MVPQSAAKDGGAFANGRTDAPLSDCGNRNSSPTARH